MPVVRAYINPEILKWARKRRGFSLNEAAKKLSIKLDKLRDAESGQAHITMSQLRKAANIYKRPLTYFYLQDIPEEDTITDFRGRDGEFNGDLDVQIREIYEKKESAEYLYSILNLNYNYSFIGSCKLSDTPEKIADNITNVINFDREKLYKYRDYSALNYWKKIVEEQGILIFQFGTIDPSITRGFSFSQTPYPTIAINAKDTPYARIFSIAHELSHLFIENFGINSGICSSQNLLNDQTKIEYLCNQVAAKILLPDDDINVNPEKISNLSDLRSVVKKLSTIHKVSWSVVLIRLQNRGLIKKIDIKNILNETHPHVSSGGGGNHYMNMKSKMSPTMVQISIDAIQQGLISELDAMRGMGITGKDLDYLMS